MDHHFLLTYSVHPSTNFTSDVEKANKVRNDIAKIEAWEKLENVETVLTGEISLYGIDSDKRKDAQKEVDKQFVSILKRHEAKSNDVTISCALMVDGLGKPIIFKVEY